MRIHLTFISFSCNDKTRVEALIVMDRKFASVVAKFIYTVLLVVV